MKLDFLLANPRKLLLVDGMGALLSTLLLLLIAYWQPFFGMPAEVIYRLIPVTTLFTIYSLSCYFLTFANWKPYLRIIAIANILYCCVTLGLVLYFFKQLTLLGMAYFLSEKVIVILLALFELKTAEE